VDVGFQTGLDEPQKLCHLENAFKRNSPRQRLQPSLNVNIDELIRRSFDDVQQIRDKNRQNGHPALEILLGPAKLGADTKQVLELLLLGSHHNLQKVHNDFSLFLQPDKVQSEGASDATL